MPARRILCGSGPGAVSETLEAQIEVNIRTNEDTPYTLDRKITTVKKFRCRSIVLGKLHVDTSNKDEKEYKRIFEEN